MQKNKKKRKLFLILGFLTFIVLYVSFYSILSFNGSYVPFHSGQNRWWFGLSIIDEHVWMPKFVFGCVYTDISGRKTFNGTFLGYFFFPCLIVDQGYVHKTIPIVSLDDPNIESEELSGNSVD